MYKIKIELDGLPPTLNSIGRKHHWFKVKTAREWLHKTTLAVSDKIPPTPIKKFKLILTRHSSSEPDYDGLVSTFKHCVDALTRCGIIEDDKLSNTGQWDCRWEKAPRGKGKVTIEVIQCDT